MMCKLKCSFKWVLAAGLILWGGKIYSQCQGDRRLPQVCWEYSTEDSNTVMFSVIWPEDSISTPYTNPPMSIWDLSVGAGVDTLGNQRNRLPQWKYFWELEDGTYRMDSTFVYTFRKGGRYRVALRTTPIYSPTQEPEIERRIITIPMDTVMAAASNFDSIENQANRSIKVEPHWRGARPGDTVTLCVTYRNLTQQAFNRGEVELFFDSLVMKVYEVRRAGNPKVKRQRNSQGISWAWEFENLAPEEERTFFVDAIISDRYGQGLTSSLLSINAFLRVTPEYDWNSLVLLPGGGLSDNSGTSYVPNTNAYYERYTTEVSVNRSRDPNMLVIEPRRIAPGPQDTKLLHTLYFENNGEAMPKYIGLHAYVDDQLNTFGLPSNGESYQYGPTGAATRMDVKLLDALNPVWTLENNTGYTGVLAPGGRGYLKFEPITRNDLSFKQGDTITGLAMIVFAADDTLFTPPAHVLVEQPAKLVLPWYWGVKGGLNNGNANFEGGFQNGGWHVGITARKALQAGPDGYDERSRIPVGALPSWWYQLELMGSKLKLEDEQGNQFQYWQVELVPLQIRYLPDFIPFFQKGTLAFSAGAKGSVFVDIEQNGSNLELGFADRIEFGGFADLSLFNILGRPGLSFGYRVNWRFNRVLEDGNPNYYQIYGHFNF